MTVGVERVQDGTLVELLAAGREQRAMAHVLDLLDAGVPVDRVVLDHLLPAQVTVGRCWERNEWSVGQSHAATAVAETVLAFLHGRVEPGDRCGRLAVVCPQEEWHALPARALALLLRARGWETAFLGPSLPPHHLERYLVGDRPQALVLSCTLGMHLPGAAHCIDASHRAGVRVLAGGRAFGSDASRAYRVGADGWAETADDAHQCLVGGWSSAPLASPLAPHPDLHELQASRHQVVDAALSRLLLQFRSLATLDSARLAQRQRQLQSLVATLEAAILVHDASLLSDYVRWFVDLLDARDQSPELVPASLAAVAAVTRPLSLAQHLLAQAEVHAAEAVAELSRRRSAASPASDTELRRSLVPTNENERLEALRRLRILDTEPEPAFDDLAHLAAKLCDTTASAITLVDADRLWLKSKVGLDVSQIERDLWFCSWTILQRDVFVVPDTAADDRFAASSLATSDRRIRFYAGVPLVTADDLALGTLWVGDGVPRELSAEQRQQLRALGRQAASQLELRSYDMRVGPVSAGPSRPTGGAEVTRRDDLLRDLEEHEAAGHTVDRLLRTREVALLFDVSERTVNYWAAQGRLPSRQTAGGHRRYAAKDVLALLRDVSLAQRDD